EFNRAAEQMFGLRRAEVFARDMAERLIPPRIRDQHRDAVARLLAREDLDGAALAKRFETVAMRADGTEFPVELAVSRIPADGPPVFTAHVRDITGRLRAERELREERDFTAAILDTVTALVMALDPSGRVVRFNRACEEASGLAARDAVGRPLWELGLVPADEVAAARETFAGLGARAPGRTEHVWLRPDGTRRRIAWATTVLAGHDGLPQHVIGTGVDVTDQRKLEEQLRQSQKMDALGRLAGGVAHDFNNLLTVIAGYGERLASPRLTPEQLARAAREINKAAERAAGLTSQLLAFSRKQVMGVATLDVNAVVSDLHGMMRRIIYENIELATVVSPRVRPVRANRGQLEQVIVNLVVNARDAMPQGGKLTIETANVELDARTCARYVGLRPGAYVMIAVSDTGTGMSAETQQRLFEPFFTTKPAGKGTGLGLSTVYGIVRERGGHVGVYSELGRGSTFKVYLPAADGADACAAAATAASPVPGGSESILLVEDEAPIRALVVETLAAHGYSVVEAGDGMAALAAAETASRGVDLLVTDVVLPGMDGRRLAD
ncbi:MAG TPA: PAS domain S-box protein, partial [Planctomycetota bacterium]|nr:PAS domain S-box protein [Planctomycetota bacterium]